ncbi:unnamed protein product [Caenorhabditis nigoni]
MILLKLLKQAISIYIVLESLFFSFCTVNAVICEGGNAKDLKTDCTIITKKPLIIDKHATGRLLESKLKHIEKIDAGLVVVGTSLSNISFPGIREIRNNAGPAIYFDGNSNLERFHTPNLEKLSGKPNALHFRNDQFIKSVLNGKDEKSFMDFQFMRKKSGHNSCDDDFYAVKDSDNVTESERGLFDKLIVTIVLLVLLALIISCTIFFCFCVSKQKKLKLKTRFCKRKQMKESKSSEETKSKSPKPLSKIGKRSDAKIYEPLTQTSNQSRQSTVSRTSISGTPGKSPISNTPSKK